MPAADTETQNIAAAITEVSERAQLLVREEIELAKAEVTEKVTKLVRGTAVGVVAGIFVLMGVALALEGFAWLLYWVLPVPNGAFFWGFFLAAVLLFVFGGLAGLIATKLFKRGAPPVPTMAIDEAKAIRETFAGENGSHD